MLQKHLIILRYYVVKQQIHFGIKKYKVPHFKKKGQRPVLTLLPRSGVEFLFLSEKE